MKNIILGSFISAALLLSSCNDLLEKEPKTDQVVSTSYKTEDDAVLLVNAVYDPISWSRYDALGDAYVFRFFYQGLRSGDHYQDTGGPDGGYFAFAKEYQTFHVTSNNLFVKALWSQQFTGVFRANLALEVLSGMDDAVFSSGMKDRLMGEAKFMRALYYFELVRNWGGVPLMEKPVSLSNVAVSRSSAAEVYDFIEKDLVDAAKVLPDFYDDANKGRPTNMSANGLLAKVYLYQNEKEMAASAAKAVMDKEASGVVGLEANFDDNFRVATEYGKESLFEVGYADDANFGEWTIQNNGTLLAQFTRPPLPGVAIGGWSYNLPTKELRAAFEEGDARIKGTFIEVGSTFNSQIMTDVGWNPVTEESISGAKEVLGINGGIWSRKYFLLPEELGPGGILRSSLNEKVLRYADVLLIYAEAKLGTPEGLDALNKVRARAGLKPLASYSLNEIMQERRVELVNEGNRFYDLVRWGKAADELGPKGFVKGRDELLPIPVDEILVAGKGKDGNNVLEQNPGF